MWQGIFTGIFFLWMFLALWLLWRHALGGSAHVQRLRLSIAELTARNAEISLKAAETALKAAEAAQAAAETAQTAAEAVRQASGGKPS